MCVYVTTSLLVGNRALRGYYASLTRCLSNHFLKEMQKTTRPMKTLLVVKTILNQKCSMPLKNQSIFKAGYCKRNLNLTCFTCMKSSFYEKTKYFLPTFLALQFPEKNPPQSIGIDSSTFLYTKWNRFHLPLVEDEERKKIAKASWRHFWTPPI